MILSDVSTVIPELTTIFFHYIPNREKSTEVSDPKTYINGSHVDPDTYRPQGYIEIMDANPMM